MVKKMTFLAGIGVGYLIGSKAGREKIMSLWNDPKVQDTVSHGTDWAKEKVPGLQEKVTGAAKDAASSAKDAAAHALKLATQAREPAPWYQHEEIGYNYRLSNVCAGIGRGQLEILDEKLRRRKGFYDYFRKAFEGTPVHVIPEFDGCTMNHWITLVTIDNEHIPTTPEDICIAMNEEGIETRPAWKPMHMQPVFKDCKAFAHNEDGSFFCETLYRDGMCLPGGDAMTAEQLDFIAGTLLSHLK